MLLGRLPAINHGVNCSEIGYFRETGESYEPKVVFDSFRDNLWFGGMSSSGTADTWLADPGGSDDNSILAVMVRAGGSRHSLRLGIRPVCR